MDGRPEYDLHLLGYRNDLARERTLRCLGDLPATLGGPILLGRDVCLPHLLCKSITHGTCIDLAARLHDCGAHVRMVASGGEFVADGWTTESRANPKATRWSTLILLVLVVLGLAYRTMPIRSARVSDPTKQAAPLAAALPLRGGLAPQLNNEAVKLNEAGDFAAAAEQVRAALRSDPGQPVLRRNLSVILRNWAVAEIRAGRPGFAVDLLSEALTMGDNAELLGTLGVAHANNGSSAEAREALERAVSLGAQDPTTFAVLGNVYRQQGERQRAVEMFQRAREHGAQGKDFDESLARLEREMDAEWDFDDRRSAHFEVSFDSGEDRNTVPIVLDSLERAYFAVGRQFDWYPAERVQVVPYPETNFHDITRAPEWTAGVYDGRIKLPVRGLQEGDAALDRTLRHEYAHVVVAQMARGRCPMWLNEGVATLMEEEGEGDRVDWAWQQLADQPLFSLRQLERPFTELPPERVRAAYAESYLAVRSLVDRSGIHRLRQLLASLGSGKSLPVAFDEVLFVEFASFEEELLRQLGG